MMDAGVIWQMEVGRIWPALPTFGLTNTSRFRRAQSVPLRLDALLHWPCRVSPQQGAPRTGPKPPLRPGHVWSIRVKLQLERRTRDLAMFNLANRQQAARLRPRGAPGGRRGATRVRGRQSNYRPEKNGSARPLRADRGHTPGAGRLPAGERPESGTILVPGPACPDQSLTTVLYAPLAYLWMGSIGLDRLKYATHSMRRTGELTRGATFARTPAHRDVRYLGVEVDDALDI